MKSYNFTLTGGKQIHLTLETTYQGWIILGRFIPDYLSLAYGNPLFCGEQNSIEESEFHEDCQRMIYCFNDNNLNYRDAQDCSKVLFAIVRWHINKYGRIIFGDLLTYTGELCELMYAMGYDIPTLKIIFPNMVAACVSMHLDNIKESIPSFSGPRMIEFTNSPRYTRLVQMCPKMQHIPRI